MGFDHKADLMRKPRDYDAELKSLNERARTLKARKVRQLGELVLATGADALDPETLAGALLALTEVTDPDRKESWKRRGERLFKRSRPNGPEGHDLDASETENGAQPARGGPGQDR